MNDITRPIVLIEDNPMDVDLTRRALARRNLVNPLIVLRDGDEALTYIRHWQVGEALPVVILLDLKLPKVDGLDVLGEIREHPQFCTVPIVILTTSSENSDIQTAYQLGANSYIIKPVDFEKFMEVTEQIQIYWNDLNTPPN
jgi:CheY-like chemotaxis protein